MNALSTPDPTPRFVTELLPASAATIARAAAALCAGHLVAFPTETVYGLGGDATSDSAVAAIFAAKQRPRFNPLILHLPDLEHAEKFGVFDERALRLAETFWPGPLTLVVRRPPATAGGAVVSLLASAGLDTVAIRVPSHPVARALLKAAGRPIAAPSANRSGTISPTTPLHVRDSLGGRIPLILAAGKCPVGLESTIIDVSGEPGTPPRLLRPGGIAREQIEALIGPLLLPDLDPDRPTAPGQLSSHYAPTLPVRLDALNAAADEALLAFGPDMFVRGGGERLNLSAGGDLEEAAANLFAMLRLLDQPHFRAIAVMPIPEQGLGLAINDRLRRAAAPRL
ncbi:MAG: L-threonylcarbamoyladenylate synthase [Azospirillaceae bacterium]|nr:L-threonylcarbamoyladenylate synthase [Azospirillaceae bacterium]